MRILGFSKKWPKLYKNSDDLFTTFRCPRADKDWAVGELVQIVYKPRSKEREKLGIVRIEVKELKSFFWMIPYKVDQIVTRVTNKEAIEDGFDDLKDMWRYVSKINHGDIHLFNKLTLCWIERFNA